MQTLFAKHQTKKEIEAEQEFEEWKKSKGTSTVKNALRWSLTIISGIILIDFFYILIDNRSPTIQSCIFDNFYCFIIVLFVAAFIAWAKNAEFRRKLKEERSNQTK